MSLPRITYAAFLASLLDLDSLEWEVTPLLFDGEPVIYAGHHHDSLIWLKRKNKVEWYRQSEVMGRLRRA
jgi:hypothetical protein